MTPIQPDLKWCTEISTAKNLPPRCPFASVHRCPRYYVSLSLLSKDGVTTTLDPKEEQFLLENWKRSDLWPATNEQESIVGGQPGRPSFFSKFCPEVSFDIFGWFASALAYHVDETDKDNAHRTLAQEGAVAHDWRWTWSKVTPLHYSECRIYSLLRLGVNDKKNRPRIGFNGG